MLKTSLTIGWFVYMATSQSSKGASVCDVLEHRLQQNGHEVEVVGRINGSSYDGFRLYEKDHAAPCTDHWIFSWPSSIVLNLGRSDWTRLKTELDYHPERTLYAVVKGRLFTRPEFYVVNLPWRQDRPFGRHVLGTAAKIDVESIQISATPAL